VRAVNLIPADQRASSLAAGRSGGGAYAVLALIGGLAILVLLYGLARHQISSRTAQLASTTARVQRAEAQARQLAPYTNFIAMREQRVRAVSEVVDSRFDWAHAMHEIGRVLPRNASISTLNGTVGSQAGSGAASASAGTSTGAAGTGVGASAAGPTGARGSRAAAGAPVSSATPPGAVPAFNLSGCAASQAAVALTLERLRLIDGVSEVVLQSSAKNGGSGASGGCGGGQPAFTIQVSFDPLPAPPAAASGTSPSGSATGAPSARTTSSTGSGG
jgi:hypothetical protein